MFRLAAAARQQVNPCAQATTARTRTATACARTATTRARTATTRARPRAAIPYEELDFVLNDPLTSQCASEDPVKLESDVKTVDVVKERIDDDDSDASDDTDDDNSDVYDVCQEKNSIRRTLKTEAFARDMHCVDSVSDNEAGAGMSLMSPAGKSHVSAALTSANPAASPTVAAPVTPMYIIDPHNFTSGRGSQVSSADQIINIMPVTYDQHVASDTSSTAGVVSQAVDTGQTRDNASLSHDVTYDDTSFRLPDDVSRHLVVREEQSRRLRNLIVPWERPGERFSGADVETDSAITESNSGVEGSSGAGDGSSGDGDGSSGAGEGRNRAGDTRSSNSDERGSAGDGRASAG